MTQTTQAIEKVQAVARYADLLRAVRGAFAGGRKRAEQAVEQEKVRTSWEIGKLIDEHILLNKKRAVYGEQVIKRLSRDLRISHTELKYMLEFAHTYPIGPPAGQLSWADHRELLAVNDDKERKSLAAQAEKERWQRERLRKEVRKITRNEGITKDLSFPISRLSAQPGKIGTYRIIRAKAGPFAGELAVDLGFSNYYKPKGKFPFQDRDLISIANGESKADKNVAESDLFTYKAYVFHVIDGDTFTAVIDLGFGFVTAQTLRLRGLDAPEIVSADGGEAKKALEKRIMKNSSPVLIRTTKSDKYDRYLVDVFQGGNYVNQELLAKGFATGVE